MTESRSDMMRCVVTPPFLLSSQGSAADRQPLPTQDWLRNRHDELLSLTRLVSTQPYKDRTLVASFVNGEPPPIFK
ncbi:hypothetical protein BDW59DRAFT_149469 [Aspergillus cavernicola]|uniref:Uncharacterized protein n=1 Tax=Aspergillus cavernicola TaxID=176166 RepID=A0ABR4I3Q2_9EURO